MNDLVALSLLTLIPGVSGGSETYVRSLCEALARVGTMHYRALVPSIAADAAGPLPSKVSRRYRASDRFAGRIAAMAQAALFPGSLRDELLQDAPAVVHFPLSVMLPPLDHPGTVTTVHDVQHEVFPRFFSRAELAYRRAVYGWTMRRSAMVITISDHSRQTLIDLGVPPQKIRRIYSGVDHRRFRPSGARREPFLLYPANRWPHKNHGRLLEALALIRRARPEMSLVLTGFGHDRTPRAEGVKILGHVDGATLVELYQTAAAVVFPSLYEGFGLPILEAMACACPVASANTSSLPEICGDAAVLFDPYDPRAIADGVLGVLDRADEFVPRGLARAAAFTWEATAREHDGVYGELSSRMAAGR